MDAYREDFQKQFKEDFPNLLNHLKNFPTTKEFNLDTSYRRVRAIIDFMQVIEKNANQLEDPTNIECVKKGVNPSAILLDYIILEIHNYYNNIRIMKNEGKLLPDLPDYLDALRDFRNASPGHRDKKHKFKTLADHTQNVKRLDLIGVLKIVEDFIDYHSKIKTNKKDFY